MVHAGGTVVSKALLVCRVSSDDNGTGALQRAWRAVNRLHNGKKMDDAGDTPCPLLALPDAPPLLLETCLATGPANDGTFELWRKPSTGCSDSYCSRRTGNPSRTHHYLNSSSRRSRGRARQHSLVSDNSVSHAAREQTAGSAARLKRWEDNNNTIVCT